MKPVFLVDAAASTREEFSRWLRDQLTGVCFGVAVCCDELRQLRQRVAHVRAVDAAEPTCEIDRAQDGVSTIDIVVDDDVLVLVPVLELGVRVADP